MRSMYAIKDKLSRSQGVSFTPRSQILRKMARIFVTDKDRIRIYKKLAKDVKYGMAVQNALVKQRKTLSRKSEYDFRAIMLLEVFDSLKQGTSFAKSFQNYAPVNDIMILEAGEKSGTLPKSLELTAEMIQASKQMKSQIFSSLAMPLLMCIMLVVLFLVVGMVVVPTLASVFPPDQWDGLSQSLYIASEIVNSPMFVIVLCSFVAFIVLILSTLSKWTGSLRAIADKIPPWSLYRLLVGGGWLLSLASLVKSGESIMQSIRNMRKITASGKTKNRWLNERLAGVLHYLSQGKNIGQALDMTGYNFPDHEIVGDLMSYADQPGFDETLYQLGQDWVQEGIETFKVQSKILNSMVFMLMGGTVSWFVLGLFQLYSQIGSSFSSGGM